MSSKRRTVRFQDEIELVPAISPELILGFVSGNWWSREEFQRFRMNNQMLVQGIRCRHEAATSNLFSYTNVLCSTYQTCVDGCSPSEENLMELAGWMETGTSRLGLEKLSVKKIQIERWKVSQSAVQAVLEAQTDKTGLNDKNDATEKVRRVYQKVTESARLFAIALADAADLAAKQEENDILNDVHSSTFSTKISHASLRLKMQRRLLFDKPRRPPLAEQFNLPLWRRNGTGGPLNQFSEFYST